MHQDGRCGICGNALPDAVYTLCHECRCLKRTVTDALEHPGRRQWLEERLQGEAEVCQDAETLVIYTDGACKGNPGPGGWGVYVESTGQELSGHIEHTTNNRAELTAVKMALDAVDVGSKVEIRTDSNNAVQWLTRNWQRKDSSVRALCHEIEDIVSKKNLVVSYVKVEGHGGIYGNEVADALATEAAKD